MTTSQIPPKTPETSVYDLTFRGTLSEWREKIDVLIAAHGAESLLDMDAGYNNISAYLFTEEDIKQAQEAARTAQAQKAKRDAENREKSERATLARLKKKYE